MNCFPKISIPNQRLFLFPGIQTRIGIEPAWFELFREKCIICGEISWNYTTHLHQRWEKCDHYLFLEPGKLVIIPPGCWISRTGFSRAGLAEPDLEDGLFYVLEECGLGFYKIIDFFRLPKATKMPVSAIPARYLDAWGEGDVTFYIDVTQYYDIYVLQKRDLNKLADKHQIPTRIIPCPRCLEKIKAPIRQGRLKIWPISYDILDYETRGKLTPNVAVGQREYWIYTHNVKSNKEPLRIQYVGNRRVFIACDEDITVQSAHHKDIVLPLKNGQEMHCYLFYHPWIPYGASD